MTHTFTHKHSFKFWSKWFKTKCSGDSICLTTSDIDGR
jgi:hypothetical protein